MTARSEGQRRVAEVLVDGAQALGDVDVAGELDVTGNALAARFLAGADSAAAPGFSWQAEDIGFYRAAAASVAAAIAGAFKWFLTGSVFSTPGAVETKMGGAISAPGDTTVDWTADQTDYALAASTARVRVGMSVGSVAINSMAGGADGRRVRFRTTHVARQLTIKHDDNVTGTAANRFFCPGGVDYVVPILGSVEVEYDATDSRWIVLGPVA